MTRACSRCGVEKSLDEFYRRRKGPFGHESCCKACRRIKKQSASWKGIIPDGALKTCKGCHKQLSLNNFYKKRDGIFGRNPRCKVCVNADIRAWRVAHPDRFLKVIQRIRQRYQRDPRLVPRRKARAALRDAVRAGKIARGPCAVCGGSPTEGHHNDYSKPFDVEWLCRPCHWRQHGKLVAHG